MRIYVSAFPVDKKLQVKLGIYDSGHIEPENLTKIATALATAGYIKISSFIQATSEDQMQLYMHFVKEHPK